MRKAIATVEAEKVLDIFFSLQARTVTYNRCLLGGTDRSFPMIGIRRVLCALLLAILSAMVAVGQPGDRRLDTKARVLDILFAPEVPQKVYFLKLVLRFGDSDTQLVVVVYSDKEKYWLRRCEITSYSVAGMGKGQLSQLISRTLAENAAATDQEIAAKLRVDVSRFSVDPEALERTLNDLKAIRISPVLASRIAVDEYSEYEFWYDTSQESVHYRVIGPFKGDPQDELVQWMIKFRARFPDLLRASPGRK
jgi:hypothetical protein